MVDVLSNSANPKHRNSKFLKFLNKLNHGAYSIEKDQLVKHPEKIKEFREIDQARQKKELLEEEKKMGDQPEAEIHTGGVEEYKNILEEDDGELTEQKVEEMMKEWMQNGEEMQNMEKMMQAWGEAWNEDFQMNVNKNPNEI